MSFVSGSLLFGASYLFIALKSLQQRNVMGLNWAWIMPTSMLMAMCEVLIIWSVAVSSDDFHQMTTIVSILGIAGGLGCLSGMLFHIHVVDRKNKQNKQKT